MTSTQKFAKLLEPGKIGQMTIKNRIVMPPMASFYGSDDGFVTQRVIEHYDARSKGGAGLVIVEYTCADAPEGRSNPHQLIIDDDRYIPGMKELAETIKRNGARAALQIGHIGRVARRHVTGLQPVGPSPIAATGREVPRQLTEAEIARLVQCFAQGVLRAKKAGFDGVEIHGAHGYLISQFLSAASNRREDRYGGSLENRARFLIEILEAVRREVGRDYPVWCRINSIEEGVENGITIEETKQVARMIEKAGADAIHLSILTVGEMYLPMAEPSGRVLPLAEAVRKEVSIPIITVRRIDPSLGETALQKGQTDFIAFGRPMLADPEFAKKLVLGNLDDIKPCLYCQNCLDSLMFPPATVRCAVNPVLGHEKEYKITQASKSKKVIVVGGGPAGMEAARIAALRGHKVQLYEKGRELGGQLILAQVSGEKQTIGDLVSYLIRQLDKLDVEVHLLTEATAGLIEKEAPDAVIMATGGLPIIPDIRGVGGSNVVLAADFLEGKAQVGDRVAIIGGELVGCEVADLLAGRGKRVTLMRRGEELALKVNLSARGPLLRRLSSQERVTILPGIQYKEINEAGVIITDKEGREQTIEADTVLIAAGAKPNTELLSAVKEIVSEVYPVGDCVEPRNIMESMMDGYYAGLSL